MNFLDRRPFLFGPRCAEMRRGGAEVGATRRWTRSSTTSTSTLPTSSSRISSPRPSRAERRRSSRARSREITRDHARSREITRDHAASDQARRPRPSRALDAGDPRSGTRIPVFQPALERTRVPLSSPVFTGIHRPRPVEAEDVFLSPNQHSRGPHSAVFGRVQLYSFSSSPLYSRGALSTLHTTPSSRLHVGVFST